MKDCKICQDLRIKLKKDGVSDWYLEDEERWEKFHNSKLHEQYRLNAMSEEDKIRYSLNKFHGTNYILEGGKK